MTDAERIEEAHGLWELAVARVAAFAEVVATGDGDRGPRTTLLQEAVIAERKAFEHWSKVSKLSMGLPVSVDLRNSFHVGLDRHGVFTDPQGSLVCTLCGPGPCSHTEQVRRAEKASQP